MRYTLLIVIAVISLASSAAAQTSALASLPEADVLIYVSPQRILNEAAPRVVPPAELTKMRAMFAELKKAAGVEPSTIEYLVIAARFHKPASDLSFVPPDVMTVIGGDFSSDSLMTVAQLYLQDRLRVEKYGSKSIAVMKVDPIEAEAEKNPMLKPFVEMAAVPLTATVAPVAQEGILSLRGNVIAFSGFTVSCTLSRKGYSVSSASRTLALSPKIASTSLGA